MNATTTTTNHSLIEVDGVYTCEACGMNFRGPAPRPHWIAEHGERVAADLGTTAAELLAR